MEFTLNAKYRQHPLRKYHGNPLIEALPEPMTETELKAAVSQFFYPGNEYWSLPEVYQKSEIQDVAMTHVPCEKFFSFYQKCFAMIINSYSHRNPFTQNAMAEKISLGLNLHKQQHAREYLSSSVLRTTAACVVVTGPSGTGKTTMIRRSMSCIPQVIRHESYNDESYQQTQIVWLSIDMPSTPSFKALALNFFKAVDEATGETDFYGEWEKRNRESIDRHFAAMQLIASTYEVGLIHIDELQFMLKYGQSVNSPTLTMLEALFNKIGIPVIISCTDNGLALLDTSFNDGERIVHEITTARRMLSDREFQLTTYRLDSPLFEDMLSALYPREVLLNCDVLGESFAKRFHELTAGLTMFMTRLAQLHHEFIIYLFHHGEKGKSVRTDDLDYLNQVHKSQFHLFFAALAHLRAEDFRKYEQTMQDVEGDEVSKVTQNKKKVKQNLDMPMAGGRAPVFGKLLQGGSTIKKVNSPFAIGFKGNE